MKLKNEIAKTVRTTMENTAKFGTVNMSQRKNPTGKESQKKSAKNVSEKRTFPIWVKFYFDS